MLAHNIRNALTFQTLINWRFLQWSLAQTKHNKFGGKSIVLSVSLSLRTGVGVFVCAVCVCFGGVQAEWCLDLNRGQLNGINAEAGAL